MTQLDNRTTSARCGQIHMIHRMKNVPQCALCSAITASVHVLAMYVFSIVLCCSGILDIRVKMWRGNDQVGELAS